MLTFLFQRISVPGISIPVTVPIAGLWLGLGFLRGLVTIDPRRFVIWCLAAAVRRDGAASADHRGRSLCELQQLGAVDGHLASPVVRLRDRSRVQYLRTLRAVANAGLGLAVLSIAFMLSQLFGLRYYDWVAAVVPHNLLVHDYVVTYPISYGSPIYKSNGWIALEPSFLSFFIAVCPGQCSGDPDERGQGAGAARRSAVHRGGIGHCGCHRVCGLPASGRPDRQPAALRPAGRGRDRRFHQHDLRPGNQPARTGVRRSPFFDLASGDRALPSALALLGRRPSVGDHRQGAGSSAEIIRGLGITGLLVPSTTRSCSTTGWSAAPA